MDGRDDDDAVASFSSDSSLRFFISDSSLAIWKEARYNC